MAKTIELTKEEVDYIKKHHKKLGAGVDGEVYSIKGNLLYKLYTNISQEVKRIPGVLTREESLYKALVIQPKIKHTNLPQNIITVDSQVVGCTYKKYNTIFGIYALSLLPINKRKEVLKELLIKIQELLDNNIYLVTLAQKNLIFPLLKNDSNILLSYRLEPLIIDLDGISAIYTEEYKETYYKETLVSLSKLIFEILLGQDLPWEYLDENQEEFLSLCEKFGLDCHLAKEYYDANYLDIETLNKVLKR